MANHSHQPPLCSRNPNIKSLLFWQRSSPLCSKNSNKVWFLFVIRQIYTFGPYILDKFSFGSYFFRAPIGSWKSKIIIILVPTIISVTEIAYVADEVHRWHVFFFFGMLNANMDNKIIIINTTLASTSSFDF